MDRIATFRTFISRTPTDPFPRYGLAMELKTRGELAEACAAFAELLDQFPDYVPTYLMAGGTLVALGRSAEAADTYRKGIEVATRRGDSACSPRARRGAARDHSCVKGQTVKKLILIATMTAALAACGGKAKKTTTPENKGGNATDVKSSGSSTGGATYGGAMKPTSPTPTGGADPCGG